MKSMSLRFRILLPVIGVIILIMLISGILSNFSIEDAFQTTITQQQSAITESLSTQVTAWIKDLQADLVTQSQQQQFTDIALNQSPSEQETLAVCSYLADFISHYSVYSSMGVINAQGKVVAHANATVVGLDLASREYFIKAMQGTPNISDVLQSKVTGQGVFNIAQPLKVGNKIIGVMFSSIDLSKFSDEFIAPVKIGQEGFAYMTDATGKISAHSDPDAIFKININDYDWGRNILNNKNGLLNYTDNNIEKIAAFSTEPTTGWTIVAVADTDDIFSTVKALTVRNLIISIIGVVILAIVIVLIVRPVTKAVIQGVLFAKEIQQGILSNRLTLKRNDEIGELGHALNSMADSLQQRAELAEAIAAGDLTQNVQLASDQDVLGRALRSMTERLNEILSQISAASEQIDSGSNQVSDSAQDLSQGATEQASAIEEIGASLNELSGRTQINAENAATASQLATAARNAADLGSSQMQQMITAMRDINESGQSISKIIKTIDEIAFQTNLLALNAAVEAARAGQHGKGFAVVAEEVRNLAARSAKAAQETANLIESSVQKGENGTEIANRTAASLTEIVTSIGKTSDLVAEIAASSKDQAEGIVQVNDGLTQVDQVVQRNTAGAEESAAAAEELSGQSAYMRELIGQFNLNGQPTSSQRSVPAPRAAAKTAIPAPAKEKKKVAASWGHVETSKPNIALDDDEFGKY